MVEAMPRVAKRAAAAAKTVVNCILQDLLCFDLGLDMM